MKYSVEGDGSRVTITVTGVGTTRAELMREFNKCADGRCSCPTSQYTKVQEIRVVPASDQVTVTLTAKPGEVIDRTDIEQCLDHTTRQVEHQTSADTARRGDLH